jgi:peptidoglycan/LPS O-acetylase OafA/YrhL
MRYRADIDGLRAVAVGAVVIYHAGFGLLPGGFVGVDIFFVISGFLITSILAAEMRADQFSLAGFYERRALRIFPALFAMLTISALAGWLILFPTGLEEFGQTLRATVLFLSNLHFAFSYDYFGESAEANSLLHTWSLAVEEQFYILFPLILYWAHKRNIRAATLWGLTLLSLGATLVFAGRDPAQSFFLPQYRAWELLCGAILAAGGVPSPRSCAMANLVGGAGLAAITFAVVGFDQTFQQTSGLWLLLPVLGATALIWAGNEPASLGARLLSLRPMVFLGLVSYSLYLWHWPVFVFWKTLVSAVPGHLVMAQLCVLSIVIAWASWRYIEQPLRRWRGQIAFRRLVYLYATGAGVMIAISLAGQMNDGWEVRFSPEIRSILQVNSDFRNSEARLCLQGPLRQSETLTTTEIDEGACRFGQAGAVDFVIWGDSHAGALIPAFQGDWLPTRSGILLARPGCPPISGLVPSSKMFTLNNVEECLAFNAMVRRYITETNPRTVLLIARWAFHLDFDAMNDRLEGERKRYDDAWFEAALKEQVAWLNTAGIEVGILAPIPFPGFDVPQRLATDLRHGATERVDQELAVYKAENANTLRILDNLEGVDILPVNTALCPDERCRITDDQGPLFADESHLSPAGAIRLRSLFKSFLQP